MMITIDTIELIDKLRATKQRLYNNMVNGDSPQPAEVVDTVVYAIQELLPAEDKSRRFLFDRVLNFYPDYED